MESHTYSKSPKSMLSKVCFSCGRAIRDWETGYVSTGLCEDCQVEAQAQADADNAAEEE